MSLDECFNPVFLKAAKSPSIGRATFKWTDPERPQSLRRYGDRIRGSYGLLYAAVAQAKGWETTATWTRPRKRDQVTVPPFKSAEAALAWLDALGESRTTGAFPRRMAQHVRDYLAQRK